MRKLSQLELDDILKKHKQWLDSRGELGERADFYRIDFGSSLLRNTELAHASFQYCSFRDVDLRNAGLQFAWAYCVDFRGADLRGATIYGAVIFSEGLGSPRIIGNLLVTYKPSDERGRIGDWKEINEEDITLYREIYGESKWEG